MKNVLNNPWVVGVLCVVALITVYFRLFDKPSRPEPSVAVPQPLAVASVVPEAPPASLLQAPEADPPSYSPQDTTILDVGWPENLIRDPFQAIRTTRVWKNRDNDQEDQGDERRQVTEGGLLLHAVFLEGPTRMAMINRQLVKEGEQVNGYVVNHIEREFVQLVGKEDTRVLEFLDSQHAPPPTS